MFVESIVGAVTVVGLHMGSVHFPNTMNNSNPGIYIKTSTGVTAGTLYNSESKQSYYLGKTFAVHKNIDVTVGAITGYKAMKVQPLVLPTVHFPITNNLNGRVGFIPKFRSNGAHAIHFMLEYQIK